MSGLFVDTAVDENGKNVLKLVPQDDAEDEWIFIPKKVDFVKNSMYKEGFM